MYMLVWNGCLSDLSQRVWQSPEGLPVRSKQSKLPAPSDWGGMDYKTNSLDSTTPTRGKIIKVGVLGTVEQALVMIIGLTRYNTGHSSAPYIS